MIFRNQNANVSKKKCKRNLQKLAASKLPRSPVSAEEIYKAFENENVRSHYGMTIQNGDDNSHGLSSKPFFKHAQKVSHENSKKDFEYCIFASENIIDGIKAHIPIDRRKFLIDATFKVCPYGPFSQFLIIYVEHLEEVSSYYLFIYLCLN